jgi:hypothetical protein
MNLDREKLILIVTRKCNLQCNHCKVVKGNEMMNFATAWKAVSLFIGEGDSGSEKIIKFFGGEPLLNFSLIKEIMICSKRNKLEPTFNLTTNGLLLKNEHIEFFSKRPDLEFFISSNQKKIFNNKDFISRLLRLPLLTVNFNLLPGCLHGSQSLFENLLKKKITRFNFLPSYYNFWPQKEIKSLRKFFQNAKKIIDEYDGDIYVKNLEVYSPVPLFNTAFTIDFLGDIYISELFLDKRLSRWRNEMKIGNIHILKDWESLMSLPFEFDFDFILKSSFSKRILESTRVVDFELTSFVEAIKK